MLGTGDKCEELEVLARHTRLAEAPWGDSSAHEDARARNGVVLADVGSGEVVGKFCPSRLERLAAGRRFGAWGTSARQISTTRPWISVLHARCDPEPLSSLLQPVLSLQRPSAPSAPRPAPCISPAQPSPPSVTRPAPASIESRLVSSRHCSLAPAQARSLALLNLFFESGRRKGSSSSTLTIQVPVPCRSLRGHRALAVSFLICPRNRSRCP